jgi:two-component system, OmpR family, sensor histidine kinase SenX3
MNTEATERGTDFNFTEYVASLAHDMKNSVGMLLSTADEIMNICTHENCRSYQQLARLQYESKRVSNNLIQLLTLYKIDKAQLSLNIDYHTVSEFLEDNVLYNKPLFDSKGISVEIDCQEGISWFFDRELISGVINNVLNNEYRYTRDRIKITASRSNSGFLSIHIDDNGSGYPEEMIHSAPELPGKTSFINGGTGLGLYFAHSVAKLHKNKEHTGYVTLSNQGIEGGGRFSLYLP